MKYHIEIRVCPVVEDGIDTSKAHLSSVTQGDGFSKEESMSVVRQIRHHLQNAGHVTVCSLFVDPPFHS